MAEADLKAEVDELREDIAKLKADVGDLVGVLRDLGVDRAQQARSSVEEELRQRREALRRGWGEAKSRGRRTVDDIEEQIEGHPMSSLMAAFGIGFVIGKLMDMGGRR